MEITVIIIFVIGVILIVSGFWADQYMIKQGEPGDVRSITAIPIMVGIIAVVLDAVLVAGWGFWRLFN